MITWRLPRKKKLGSGADFNTAQYHSEKRNIVYTTKRQSQCVVDLARKHAQTLGIDNTKPVWVDPCVGNGAFFSLFPPNTWLVWSGLDPTDVRGPQQRAQKQL
jgi:hypothetical protein